MKSWISHKQIFMNTEVTHFTQPIILLKRDAFLNEIGGKKR